MTGLTSKIKSEINAITIFFSIFHVLLVVLITLGLFAMHRQPLLLEGMKPIMISSVYLGTSIAGIVLATLLFGRSTEEVSDAVTNIWATLTTGYAIMMIILIIV